MIRVDVKPRADNRFDIYVTEDGEPLLNSSQGYENVEDAEWIAGRVFGTRMVANAAGTGSEFHSEPVAMIVTYRDGTTKTERLR